MRQVVISLISLFLLGTSLFAQESEAVRAMIERHKQDIRGPYKDIRWFCTDGSTLPPKEKCAEPGAVQRARYKDEVVALGEKQHIFLGQILSTTSKIDFWDAQHQQSRLKQYQMEKYLRSIDNGWVLQKGQYYRGAFQVEDEQAWGRDFLLWVMRDTEAIECHYFLLRQAIKDIPHLQDDNRTLRIRAVSKVIADLYPAFMDLRVKIHGQPEEADLARVKAFRAKHKAQLTPDLLKSMDELITDMNYVYESDNQQSLEKEIAALPGQLSLRAALLEYVQSFGGKMGTAGGIQATAQQLLAIRKSLPGISAAITRLQLLDIAETLEGQLFREIGKWNPKTLKDACAKVYALNLALAGTGMIELWEWEALSRQLQLTDESSISLKSLKAFLDNGQRGVEWGTTMTTSTYDEVLEVYGKFEPLSKGFTDDKIRASLLLPLGNSLGDLGTFVAQRANFSNQVLDIPNQSHIRGLNPGYAMGELVVVPDAREDFVVSPDKIYVFQRPPADLKPVGGIATVTEGNMVSHVQLLARNLGIPNSVLSQQNIEALAKYSGQQVFYAVSLNGRVIIKPVADMTSAERELFAVQKRSEEKIEVPVEEIRLEQKQVLNLRSVRSTDSGKLCGPKAANLGQLKFLFPENVVEGIVIPFGIFRDHMDQQMPGKQISYWTYLNQIFQQSREMQTQGKSSQEVDAFTLSELSTLREAIKAVNLKPAFVSELKRTFSSILGKEIGEIPVFLRSDTNMEDLKDFSGAGLNLTLFNVLDEKLILQGIKDVWASPYTERSYKWRQNYLLNPENVFPSILIIPSVNVDRSGVVITKGILTDNPDDISLAFSRGVGGAVDGQLAESYLLSRSTNMLLSPAREPHFNRIPATGGRTKSNATFEEPVLSANHLAQIRKLDAEIRQKLPGTPGIGGTGPFDIELGFLDDQLWLFQVRPFVENKNARSSTYLQAISPQLPQQIQIDFSSPF